MGYFNGDVVNRCGFTFKINMGPDDQGPPWEESDGHGPVEEHKYSGNKRPGQRPLNSDGDWRWHSRNTIWMYDWQAATKLAKKERWGCNEDMAQKYFNKPKAELTHKQQIYAAVAFDFDYLRGWLNNEWHWMYVAVTCEQTKCEESLGGIGSCEDDYINDTIDELIDSLTPLSKFEKKMREAAEKAR